MEPDPLASGPRRVEAYLDQILMPLARSLAPFHRDELRRELRAHLWARVEAYRELGQPEDEAVTEALRQFGGAEDFTRQWRREWTQAPRRLTFREVYEAGRQALWTSLMGVVAAILPFILLQESYSGLRGSPAGALLESYRDVPLQVLTGFAFLVLPAIVGVRHGRRTSQHANIGLPAVLTAETLFAYLLYRLVIWNCTMTDALYGYFGLSLFVLAAWIPVAGSAAALGGWWTRRSQARHLA